MSQLINNAFSSELSAAVKRKARLNEMHDDIKEPMCIPDKFQEKSEFHENIRIVFLGPVSAGKSTLLNALFSTTYSEMKRKKTTMVPQEYQTVLEGEKIDNDEQIFHRNKKSNDEVLKKREIKEYDTINPNDILVHCVKQISEFITIKDKTCTYSIVDVPGLNCSDSEIYYDYIKKIAATIDIYVLIFDITSVLNTTDEVKILKLVNELVKKTESDHNYVHVIMNKCDDVEYDDGYNPKFEDEELQESWEDSNKIIYANLKDIPKDRLSVSALSSQWLYVYRGAKHNIDGVDITQIDKILKHELGRTNFAKFKNESQKRKYLSGMIKDKNAKNYDKELYKGWMQSTGYSSFKKSLDNMFENYEHIIEYHIYQDAQKTNDIKINNYNEISSALEMYKHRINKLKELNKKYEIHEEITELFEIIGQKLNKYIQDGVNSYSGQTISLCDEWINNIKIFWNKFINIFNKKNLLEQALNDLVNKRYILLNKELENNFNEIMFKELYIEKRLDMSSYTESIQNLFINNPDEWILVLESVYKIISKDFNDEKYIKIILDNYTNNINLNDINTTLFLVQQISKIIGSDFKWILQIINHYFYNVQRIQSVMNHALYWINSNQELINKSNENIQYIYYSIFQTYVTINSANVDFETFKKLNNGMLDLYTILNTCLNNKQSIQSKIPEQKIMEVSTSDLPKANCSSRSDSDTLISDKGKSNSVRKLEKKIIEEMSAFESDEHVKSKTKSKKIILEDLSDSDEHVKSKTKSKKIILEDLSDSDENFNYNSSDDSDTVFKKTISSKKRIKKF
jgi:hypothetical protein